jgi:hypothetical protein
VDEALGNLQPGEPAQSALARLRQRLESSSPPAA